MGVEPTYAAWEAAVLPMNYIRRCSFEAFPWERSGIIPEQQTETSAAVQSTTTAGFTGRVLV